MTFAGRTNGGTKAKSISFRLVKIEIPCDLKAHGTTVKSRVEAPAQATVERVWSCLPNVLGKLGYLSWGRPDQVCRWRIETLRAESLNLRAVVRQTCCQ